MFDSNDQCFVYSYIALSISNLKTWLIKSISFETMLLVRNQGSLKELYYDVEIININTQLNV